MLQNKLRELRKSKGLSQEELAIDLHESQNTISNIETGKQKTINLQLLNKIASYFQVQPYELLSDDNNSITISDRTENRSMTTYQNPNAPIFDLVNLLREQLQIKDRQIDEKDKQILKLLELIEVNFKVYYFH